jgi:hypothetical protein
VRDNTCEIAPRLPSCPPGPRIQAAIHGHRPCRLREVTRSAACRVHHDRARTSVGCPTGSYGPGSLGASP